MKKNKNQKGQAIVEFALVVPLLLIFIMAIIEFGFMFNAYLTISSASREAARVGAVGASNTEVELMVINVASHLESSEIDVTITPSSRNRGDMLRVTVEYDYQLITPIISNMLSPFVDLKAETVMRIE